MFKSSTKGYNGSCNKFYCKSSYNIYIKTKQNGKTGLRQG